MRLLRRQDVLLRLGLCLLAALILWAATGAWNPPFAYRSGDLPSRDIVARIRFKVPDPEQTRLLTRQKIASTICAYENDKKPLMDLRRELKSDVFEIKQAASFAEVPEAVWQRFLPPAAGQAAVDQATVDEEQYFKDFRQALAEDMELAQLDEAVRRAMEPIERHGLLDKLSHTADEGDQAEIEVHPLGNEAVGERVEVKRVRIAEVSAQLEPRLAAELRAEGVPDSKVEMAARLLGNWFRTRGLPVTLKLNRVATQRAYDVARASVAEAKYEYQVGERLVEGGHPLTREDTDLLREEYRAMPREPLRMVAHSLADLGMYVALYVLCGFYIYYHEPRILRDPRHLAKLLGLVVVTVILAVIASRENWRAELIALMLFAMIVSIAYHRELSLLLSAAVTLIVCLSLGQSLPEMVILLAAISAAVLLLGRIRSRTRLIYVGLGAGAAALLTTVGVSILAGQAFGASELGEWWSGADASDPWAGLRYPLRILAGATWYGFCAVLAGFLMTGLLPFVERLFDVQTDLSLLELGHAAHPLMQELARRAPGTYNHSINVASIAEAAAEAIGANGLLVRVGAYFHDIGKMLKPGYFVENQGADGSRHDSLVPAMSTLVIIAHVKDGADLARKHHLPQTVIDFIEQHHGTTLVEYFYRQAAKQCEQFSHNGPVDESNFRYPGPKPQTREAGVLMLADAVESACRTLTDPAPSRIEGLVADIAMKRLMDGQFDECGLTLKELQLIEESLAKSLTAVYHGRVKYPDQQTA